MDNNNEDFHTFIENIILDKNNHHLVFDENKILKRIICLYGINDEIATITVGKQYEFKNNVPEPYFNYIFNEDIDVNYIILDEKQYEELFIIGETINNIYSFNGINKDKFDEILEDIKHLYLKDSIQIETEEVKQYYWNLFKNYANDYLKIIDDTNKPKFYRKYYDEDDYNAEIYDKIYDLQKLHKENIIKEIVNKYDNIL
jgi:hypothetical protein